MSAPAGSARSASAERVLPRRRFLKGLGGAALGLPFLEAVDARAAQAPIVRFGVFFCCNGVEMSRWFPNGAYGALTDAHLLGTANEALIPFRRKLLFPRGLHMAPRSGGRDPGGGDDHGRCMAHKLTAFPADSKGLAQGPSIDYVLSRAINPGKDGSRRPPLNLWVGKPGNYASLDYISYSEAGRAVAGINNPWDAYTSFIGLDGSASGSAVARERLRERRESVLDLVQDRFEQLRAMHLSRGDEQKLDRHFTAIRELEVEVSASGFSCADPTVRGRAEPFRNQPDRVVDESQYPTIANLQVDLFALALACDVTRVATLHFDRGSGGPTFKWEGMKHEYNHHKLSHGKVRDDCFGESTAKGCDNVEGFREMLFDIDRWHQRRFARLLEKLDGYDEADGRSVLDNSLILYTNEMSDGKLHSFMDLPYILAGSAAGRVRQNLYYPLGPEGQTDASAPHNRLLNTLSNVMGVRSDWFGLPQGQGGATMQGGIFPELLMAGG